MASDRRAATSGRNKNICSSFSNWSGKIVTSKNNVVCDSGWTWGWQTFQFSLGRCKRKSRRTEGYLSLFLSRDEFPDTYSLFIQKMEHMQKVHLPLQCMGRIPLSQFPRYPAHTGKPGPWDHHCNLDCLRGGSSPPDSVHSAKQACQFFWSAALRELL